MIYWLVGIWCLLVAALPGWAGNTHGTPDQAKEMQAWFGDALSGYVVSGCLPATSGTTTTGTFACSAYVKASGTELVYVTQPTKTVTLSGGAGVYWLAVHRDLSTAVASWTRQAGTHYLWRLSATKPANPTNGLIIAQATVTGGGTITPVVDYRKPRSLVLSGRYDLTDPLYGGAGDAVVGGSGTDNTGPLNLALAASGVEGGVIWFPAGRYNFDSKPNALQNGTMLRCAGHKLTVLVRKYTEADAAAGFIDMDVANTLPVANVTNAGGGVNNCALYAESGTTGGSAINIVARDTAAQGFLHIDFTYITGAGTWNYDLRMDGSTAISSPQGVRVVFISNSHFFQSTVAGILAIGVNNIGITNVGVFTNTDQCLIIDGGTGGTVPTNYVRADMIFCDKVKIGATVDTNQVWYSSPNTTTLVTAATMSNLTIAGNVATVTGSASTGSGGTGFFTPGKILAGLNVPTTGGGKIEVSNGITFPATQSAVSNVNTLDDYMEATFTPTLGGSAADGTPTYTVQDGIYTKVGRLVTVNMRLGWNAWTGSPSGNLLLRFSAAGLTATSGSGNALYPCAVGSSSLVVGAAGVQLQAVVSNAGQYALIQAMDVAGGAAANLVAGADTVGNLYVSCTFFTTP